MFIRNAYRMVKKVLGDIKYAVARKRYPVPQICQSEDTLKKIINEKCSFSRYGDGELNLILGNSIDFQKYDYEMAVRLKEILISDHSSMLIGLPDMFRDRPDLIEKTQAFWRCYNYLHWSDWGKVLMREKVYYDACITRFYLSYKNKAISKTILELWKSVWDKRELLIVEGEQSRLGVGNDLFCNAKSIKRILCPSIDAYSVYDKILLSVSKVCGKDDLILIALGPTATILAYDLFEQGFQALDIGHIDIEYEWMLMNATNKIVIEGKYTNEVEGGKEVADIENPLYNEQVIMRI